MHICALASMALTLLLLNSLNNLFSFLILFRQDVYHTKIGQNNRFAGKYSVATKAHIFSDNILIKCDSLHMSAILHVHSMSLIYLDDLHKLIYNRLPATQRVSYAI